MASTSTERNAAALAAAALAAVVFVVLRGAPVYLPHQGVHALLAADSLARGDGFTVAPGLPYAKFGPSYPLMLAALARAGIGLAAGVALLNAAAFGLAAWFLFAFCRPLAGRAAWLIAGLFVAWAPTHYLLRGARPDLVVLALTLTALYGTARYAARPSLRTLLATAAVCATAACTRYMSAITLLPVTALAIATLSGPALARRVRALAAFGAVSGLPFLAWIVRNVVVTGYLTGMSRTADRPGLANRGLAVNLRDLGEAFVLDAFAHDAMGIRQVLYDRYTLDRPAWTYGTAVLAIGLFGFVLWSGRRHVGAFVAERRAGRSAPDVAWRLCAAYSAVYLVALIAVWSLSNNDPINTRYLSSVYAPLCVVVAPLLLRAVSRSRSPAAAAALAAATLTLAAPNAVKSARMLVGDPPGNKLIYVSPAGKRRTTWVRELDRGDLAPLREMLADDGD